MAQSVGACPRSPRRALPRIAVLLIGSRFRSLPPFHDWGPLHSYTSHGPEWFPRGGISLMTTFIPRCISKKGEGVPHPSH